MSSTQAEATSPAGTNNGHALPPVHDIDWWTMLMAPDFLTNPYADLKRIREMQPVHFDPVSGIYFVMGYREFAAMAKTQAMGRDTSYWATGWNSEKNRKEDPETYELFVEFQPQMINANPPEHRRMRDVYARAFRAHDMNRYLAMVEEECDKLIEALPVGEPFDFMEMFGNPLPHRVSLKLFDIPDEMVQPIADWIAALSWLGNIVMSEEQKRAAQQAQTDFKAFAKEHLARQKQNPGDGFIRLSLDAFENGVMDEEETLNNVVMLISGSRTSLTLLGNGLVSLLNNQDQFDMLRADRTLMTTAIEEMLRYESGSAIIPRAGVKDFRCGDVTIPAGSLAIGLVGAINRDPTAFENPDDFDITRKPNRQLAFGGGPHVCIGKALARMTARVGFNALMDRFSRIELAGEPEWWTDRSDQRGLNSLPVILHRD